MASKLCCMAEQEGRSDSPELPNARLGGATPAKRPLLPKQTGSPNSRFTSVRSDELHELHQIFDHAQDDEASPIRTPRTRFSRASIYSLHSLHKMTSMRSLIKRKFSRDLVRKDSGLKIHIEATQKVTTGEQDTIVRTSKDEAKQQLKITKDDLRKDLLSDKKPDEGGYDSDAEMLDDFARNLGKKTPSKRASIHSVNWSPSIGSKATPVSSTKSRTMSACNHDLQPYQIQKPPAVSLATRVSHVFSTPNLRVDVSDQRNLAFRRSQSATSTVRPEISPPSPLRLPSLTSNDPNGVPWAQAINESLRLSQILAPPRQVIPQSSQTLLPLDQAVTIAQDTSQESGSDKSASSRTALGGSPGATVRSVEIRVQQPTSVASPRPPASIRGAFQDNSAFSKDEVAHEDEVDEEDNPRQSVHLYSMRISHHLRSGSLLSWEQPADAPELPAPTQLFHDRTVTDQVRLSRPSMQLARHERQTSSSGFASSKVPPRWGKVLPTDHDIRGDMASSIYSSRPQSPPDSLVASLTSLGRTCTGHDNFSNTPIRSPQARRSNSFPTDNENTPRAVPLYGSSNLRAVQGVPMTSSLLVTPVPLARKNSVADTKKSKFREEFSPSPPRKKATPSESIMRFLNPKRLSARSQSEASLKSESPIRTGDGAVDTLEVPTNRERRQSQSMMSLQTEKDALGKGKGADHVWNQALKAHQEEKASLFLPKNRDLATYASPFRERSGSTVTRHSANEVSTSLTREAPNASGSLFVPSYAPSFALQAHGLEEFASSRVVSRRSAMASAEDKALDRAISIAFEKQGDSPDVVGAWGRYPSHTRDERTNSASKADRVESRDFALEAAIEFASAQDMDDNLIDPTERVPSMPLMPGERKRKKKVGSSRMAKSNSMTFGKTFLKNYSKIFKSSSTEFRKHGRNHRSSIAAGGVLEFPELEILPEVWKQGSSLDGSGDRGHRREESMVRRRASDSNEAGKSQTHDSMATLRPRRNSSAPNLNELASHDGANEDKHAEDNARVWSVYYDDCVRSYPCPSAEIDFGLKDFGRSARNSFDSITPSQYPHTMPARLARHSRNASRVSRTSIISRGSARPSFKSMGKDDEFAEKRSMASVRRSTMDLISKFKEQEVTERERVLSITRAGSCYKSDVWVAS
ncbi:Nicotinamide-nucleotide adenylyltransferase [Ascochyta rabiei]|uniref:Uncharacterized protein n=1 Tax=Didymella rabiei TaxID=5454 RepID=A0A162YIC1_DIDRA|nr:Nicotinamide-nucleotide adenylyltransferase [Ascochyta rabiei]KZM20061.1 hypothetical protein ST47_g8791 [Ascochyta rabiei]UPX17161.1 Nicotinamide-nucleotide adenylyltransferase [Ascochyta rabiei]